MPGLQDRIGTAFQLQEPIMFVMLPKKAIGNAVSEKN